MGQLTIGIVLMCLSAVGFIMMTTRYESVLCSPCLEEMYGDSATLFSPASSEAEQSIRLFPVGILMVIPPLLASALYLLRSLRGAFSRLKEAVRRKTLAQRWLIRMAWSTPLVILVSLLFGVTSLPVLITIGALNVLSHVFLIEMDRTNRGLPYVDWAPLFISMLLFASTIIVVISVGFDSLQLRTLPQMTRFVLIGYLLVQLIFYVETVMHYGGYGPWKKPEYSDNAFSLNDVTVHLSMLLLFISLLDDLSL